jgi:hypothetical protein
LDVIISSSWTRFVLFCVLLAGTYAAVDAMVGDPAVASVVAWLVALPTHFLAVRPLLRRTWWKLYGQPRWPDLDWEDHRRLLATGESFRIPDDFYGDFYTMKQMQQLTPEIFEFMRGTLAKRPDFHQIRGHLLAQGWSEEDVDVAAVAFRTRHPF